MSSESSQVFLRHGGSGELVEADLYDGIEQRHLIDHRIHWKPLVAAEGEQHEHWDWEEKWLYFSPQLRFRTFALECLGETQGLMIVNTSGRCRISRQANKHLVYVEYLEVAPWNRRAIASRVQYKGVGTAMLAAAIQLSIEEGIHYRRPIRSIELSAA